MALLEEITRDSGYRWTDEFTEAQLLDFIEDGKEYISTFKPSCDFENASAEKTLLKKYVRYCIANALPDFYVNYHKELVRLSNQGMVARRKTEESDAGV